MAALKLLLSSFLLKGFLYQEPIIKLCDTNSVILTCAVGRVEHTKVNLTIIETWMDNYLVGITINKQVGKKQRKHKTERKTKAGLRSAPRTEAGCSDHRWPAGGQG